MKNSVQIKRQLIKSTDLKTWYNKKKRCRLYLHGFIHDSGNMIILSKTIMVSLKLSTTIVIIFLHAKVQILCVFGRPVWRLSHIRKQQRWMKKRLLLIHWHSFLLQTYWRDTGKDYCCLQVVKTGVGLLPKLFRPKIAFQYKTGCSKQKRPQSQCQRPQFTFVKKYFFKGMNDH